MNQISQQTPSVEKQAQPPSAVYCIYRLPLLIKNNRASDLHSTYICPSSKLYQRIIHVTAHRHISSFEKYYFRFYCEKGSRKGISLESIKLILYKICLY